MDPLSCSKSSQIYCQRHNLNIYQFDLSSIGHPVSKASCTSITFHMPLISPKHSSNMQSFRVPPLSILAPLILCSNPSLVFRYLYIIFYRYSGTLDSLPCVLARIGLPHPTKKTPTVNISPYMAKGTFQI